MISLGNLGGVARVVATGIGPQPSPKPAPAVAVVAATAVVPTATAAMTTATVATAGTAPTMSTSAATSSGAPAPPQSGTSTPLTPPPGVTQTTTIGGVTYWGIPGQYITQNGAQVWVPFHWVKADPAITSSTVDPNKVTVDTHSDDKNSAGNAVVQVGAKSWLFTDDQSIDLANFMGPLFKRNGASDAEFNTWSHQSMTGVDDKGADVMPGVPHAKYTTYPQDGSEVSLRGKQGLVLLDKDALAAHEEGQEPADYYATQWVKAIRAQAANDAKAKAGGSSGATGGAGPAPTPPPGAPGTSTGGKPTTPVTTPTAASSTTRTLGIVALAVGVAWLLLGCHERDDSMTCTASAVNRLQVNYPFLLGNFRSTLAVPGPTRFGTNILLDSGVNSQTKEDPTDPFTATIQTAAKASQRVAIPTFSANLRGIGIASDSMLDTCDVSIDGIDTGPNRWRIGVGNPLIGDFGVQSGQTFMTVSIPNPMPDLEVDAPGANTAFAAWDATNISPVAGGIFAAWPLRLEFYYGDILPIRGVVRAPMSAAARILLTANGVAHLVVCVAGRKKLRLVVLPSTGTASVTVVENVMHPPNGGGVLWNNTQLSILAATPVATAKAFDLTTGAATVAPYGTIDIAISDTAGTGATVGHYIVLQAWD